MISFIKMSVSPACKGMGKKSKTISKKVSAREVRKLLCIIEGLVCIVSFLGCITLVVCNFCEGYTTQVSLHGNHLLLDFL